MFDKILIANRGEIACRIARTCHEMGISTVGVYSEPDRDALHVDAVDVAVALGGSTPAESYLRGDAIIAAAISSGDFAIGAPDSRGQRDATRFPGDRRRGMKKRADPEVDPLRVLAHENRAPVERF